MKKLVAATTLAIILAGCSSTAATGNAPVINVQHDVAVIKSQPKAPFWVARMQQTTVEKVVAQLKARVGKTWYVFSGATPRGWDCSGMTMWAYEQLGFQIPHSANKQSQIGITVKKPQLGDLVLFGYKGTNSYFHAAIYVGQGKFIHAGFRKGQTTKILPLTDPSVKGTKIKFVRLLPTNYLG